MTLIMENQTEKNMEAKWELGCLGAYRDFHVEVKLRYPILELSKESRTTMLVMVPASALHSLRWVATRWVPTMKLIY